MKLRELSLQIPLLLIEASFMVSLRGKAMSNVVSRDEQGGKKISRHHKGK